ncbi:MAG: ribosomal protein L15 [uncultured bacterium]|nr:MAG: ribosomal protein L15 [uncultured bacterium]KKT02473.1 MAG: 50S ribosomal protein L15, large subunit ribosomal protein L15 [Candidatus Peregrinibacteria bacterium GW2011_GWF2_43_17]KKT19297.1 MAG: 50S ribosomal protein L15 [Candidatus Peregrinibacteria bacterium GW2011_GWA2_43_8]HAU40195.1 50S ribosomal protein L15 [Candidatus Peregrinibacteria bacterium]
MRLHQLKGPAKNKVKRRKGRGNGSGRGTFSGRGCKGQKARSGGGVRPGFEGGQTPFMRKMPKLKGFKSPNKVRYQVLNVRQLNILKDGTKVTKAELLKHGLIASADKPVKILSQGELTKKLTLIVENVSAEALKKIKNAGGKVKSLGNPRKTRKKKILKRTAKKKAAKTAKKAKK